jgi:hypothetical protein
MDLVSEMLRCNGNSVKGWNACYLEEGHGVVCVVLEDISRKIDRQAMTVVKKDMHMALVCRWCEIKIFNENARFKYQCSLFP